MSSRYLKQVIVVRKDLSMPSGKLAAMVAHAAMSFLLSKFEGEGIAWAPDRIADGEYVHGVRLTAVQSRWLTELDPGLEDLGQVSMAKIVCQIASEAELLAVEQKAKDVGLECHRVIDSGHSHNPAGTLVCIAIGPDWPEQLGPVTGTLKVYR